MSWSLDQRRLLHSKVHLSLIANRSSSSESSLWGGTHHGTLITLVCKIQLVVQSRALITFVTVGVFFSLYSCTYHFLTINSNITSESSQVN